MINDEQLIGFMQSPENIKFVIIKKVLKKIEEELKIFSSTPIRNSQSGKNIMDISFPKIYDQISQNDNDSGYVSQSTSEIAIETNMNSAVSVNDSIYLSEDALLEEPKNVIKNENTEPVYEEFSQQYYVNSIIDESVSPIKSENFRGLQDSSVSIPSEISPDLDLQPQIKVNKSSLSYFIIKSPVKSDTNILQIESELNLNKKIDDDLKNPSIISNIENINPNDLKLLSSNKKCTPKKFKKRKRSESCTPPKKNYVSPIDPDKSPDLFSDSEPDIVEYRIEKCEKYLLEQDRVLVKNVTKNLSGVPPPRCLTTIHISVTDMLQKIRNNKNCFWDSATKPSRESSLLINTTLDKCLVKKWPDILQDRYHGLFHNRSKASEEFESLCMKYLTRYVSSETQSSCTVFDVNMNSPSKRKSNKLRWLNKSPGRRLSHLARRRITFSSANLQGNASGSTSNARQILIDAKRYELLTRRVSPRKTKSPRKTPKKTPRKNVKTPTSSAKKKLIFKVRQLSQDEAEAGPSTSSARASTTKRALFQSPDSQIVKVSKNIFPSTSNSSLSPWKKKNTPKRALFCSPNKNSSSKILNNKRKRTDSDDMQQPCKLPRSLSLQVENTNPNAVKLSRVKSESCLSVPPPELSELHKKKLQWAVYETLRGQNIGLNHPQFKQIASVLARVTRRLLPTIPANGPKPEVGTSERMLRIAKQHVFAASKGKSVEEIILAYEASKAKTFKPTGYVSKEDLSKIDISNVRSKETVFQDRANTLNSLDKSCNDPGKKPNKPENKIERVKKIINFDDDSSLHAFR